MLIIAAIVLTSIIFFFLLLPPILLLIFVKKKNYFQLSENQKYAGFWHRLLAGIIDLIILYVVSFILGYTVGSFFLINMDYEMYFYTQWAMNILSIIISFLYYILFQMSSKQATLGMMLVGIKIYDEELQRVGFWRLTGRYFTTGLSNLILWIGFFMIGWTNRKQGLHDILARTIHLKK